MRWGRKRKDLAERLRPYVEQHRVLSEPMVDADPIRMFLYRWMIETGDPIDVVARGFDVDVGLVRDIADRRLLRIPESQARALAERLEVPLSR